jgi:hypothetical protein
VAKDVSTSGKRSAAEVDVLEGEISGSVQAYGAVVRLILVPRLVARGDLPTWVDQCATRLMDAIANLGAVKAHVAKQRPEWIPMEPISDLEFVNRLRLTDLSVYSDGRVSVGFDFNDGDELAGFSATVLFHSWFQSHRPVAKLKLFD